MTRKHYVAIAEELARELAFYLPGDVGRLAVAMTALRLANRFAAENPRFDAGRFLRFAVEDDVLRAHIVSLGGPA